MTDRMQIRRWSSMGLVSLGLLLSTLSPSVAFCREASATPSDPATQSDQAVERVVELVEIPQAPLDDLDPAVREVIETRLQGLQGALSGNPDPKAVAEVFGDLGFIYHAHELWDSALACYTNALRTAPDDPRWTYAMALVLRNMGDLDGAAAAYEDNLELLRRNTTALIGLAEVRLEQNMPLVSKALLNHALEISAESPAALATLGQIALSTKEYDRAVTYFERALTQVPDANRLHYPLALAYRGLGDLDKAKEHLAKRGEIGVRAPDPILDAIEERKTGERVMILEGRRAFAVGRYAEAAERFNRALESNPESIPARVNLATALGAGGDVDGAMAQYRLVLERQPNNSAASFNLGALLLQQNKTEEAVALLEKAVAADSRDDESRAQLARAYERQGKLSEALTMIKEAVTLNRSNQSMWLFGQSLMTRMGNHGEARAWLEEAHRSMPDQGLVALALAELLATSPELQVRDGEKAVGLAARVASTTGKPNHWLTLSKALAESGRCEDAAEVIKQLLDKAPPEAQEALNSYLSSYQSGPPCRP